MSTAGAPTGKASSKRKKRPRRPPIPRDSTVVVSRWQGIKTKLQHLRDFLTLYWQSAKLFAAEVRLAFRLGYNIYLKGHRYTRAERRAMQKAAVDIIKILPLASMTMVVGTEITALLAARAIPNMLPRAFKPVADKVDENLPKFVDKVLPSGKDRRKAHADSKVEVADNLHALSLEHVSKLQRKVMQQSKDAAAFAASRASGALAAAAEMSNSGGERASLGGAADVSFRGQRPVKYDENLSEYAAGDAKLIADFLAHMDNHETRLTARDIAAVGPAFRRHMQLQQLSRLQLVRMNQYMNQGSELMNLVLPTFVLVRRLRRAIATARTDDKDIHFEGVSSLSLDELRDACIERGVSVNFELALRNRLRNWISLSINRDVPSSLLILSSALISRSQLRLEQEYGASALQAETLRARINELDQLILKRTQQRQEVQQKLDLLLEAQNEVGDASSMLHPHTEGDEHDKLVEEEEIRGVLVELEAIPDDVAEAEAEALEDAEILNAKRGSRAKSDANGAALLDHIYDYEPENILLLREIFHEYQDGNNSKELLRVIMIEALEVVTGDNTYEDGLWDEMVESYLLGHDAAAERLSWARFLADVSDLHRSVDVVQSDDFASEKRLRESRELIASRTRAIAQIEGILSENPEEVAADLRSKKKNAARICGHGAAVLDNYMYILGGLVPAAGKNGNTLHSLDLIAMKWAPIGTPAKLAQRTLIQHSMTSLTNSRGFFVASGAFNVEGQEQVDASAYYFDGSTSTWLRVSNGQRDKSVGGSSSVVINGTLFVLGGYVDDAASNAFRFLSAAGEFHNVSITKQKAGEIGPIAFQGALAIHNEFMVVYGGFSDASINPFIWLFVWEDFPTQGFWCRAKTSFAPPPHFASGFEVIEDRLYAFGGRIHPRGDHEELSADMWRYDGIINDFAACKNMGAAAPKLFNTLTLVMARKRGREPLAELTAPAYAAGAEAALEAGSCDQQQAEPPAKRRCGAEMQGRMPAAVTLGPSRPAVSASAVREEQANVDNSAKIQNATPPESVAEFRSPSFQVVTSEPGTVRVATGRTAPRPKVKTILKILFK
eukprot:g1679.t1